MTHQVQDISVARRTAAGHRVLGWADPDAQAIAGGPDAVRRLAQRNLDVGERRARAGSGERACKDGEPPAAEAVAATRCRVTIGAALAVRETLRPRVPAQALLNSSYGAQ